MPPQKSGTRHDSAQVLSSAISSFLLALALITKFARTWFCRFHRVATCRPIRAVSTPMPSITTFSSAVSHNKFLSREICKLCFRANPVGFSVPDEIWTAVTPPEYHSKVLCISCFARLADEKLIRWEHQIQLYPVSMRTHIEKVKI